MVTGVGFLLFHFINGSPKIFVIRELKDKPVLRKKAGMLSFPLETFKDNDHNHLGTIVRLLEEEVGIALSEVEILGVFSERFNLIPGRKDIETVYGYGLFLGDPCREFIPDDDDIVFAGWMTLAEILQHPIRVEVAPIIDHFKAQGINLNP